MGVKDSLLGRLLGNADKFSREQVAQTITLLLEHGLKRGASDIHIEPHGQVVWVRYRIHGHLHGQHRLPMHALSALLTELKQHAGLIPSDTMPQEAPFTYDISGTPVELRLNTMPVVGGERAVIRYCETLTNATAPNLEALGLWGASLDLIRTTLAHAHGLVIVTGPKRSNRPATLYGMLHLLRTTSISVATIEETIERRIPGLSQTKVSSRSSSAYDQALQAALRQDMNVIMLDDLPAAKVAADAVHAATSGHFIAAGMHSNNAARAILHLKHMGVESYMLAASIRLVIGQHPVRRLCPSCRERLAPSSDQLARLESIFGMNTPINRKRMHSLEQLAKQAGIGTGQPLNSTATHLTHLWRANSNGCEDCHHTGYQGTVMLTEVFPGGEYLYKALENDATVNSLQAAALKLGFVPLALDGIIKALRGETTVTEVMHAVGQA